MLVCIANYFIILFFPVLFMSQTGWIWAFVGRPGSEEGGGTRPA